MSGFFGRLKTLYERSSRRTPLLVQASTAGCVAAVGDVAMQVAERWRDTPTSSSMYDPARTARIASFRLLIFGPAYSLWLRCLERLPMPKAQGQAVLLKVLLDQSVWTPPSIGAFYTWMGCWEGLPPADCAARARAMLWPTLQVNWPFWGGIQLFTFSAVPPPWRVAWISVVHVFWNAFLSSMNQTARSAPPVCAPEATSDGDR